MPGRLVHIPLWWVLVGVASCILTPILSIFASVQIAQNNQAETQRVAAAAEVRVREEGRQRMCRLVGAQVDVYKEASTPVGLAAYETWLVEYRTQGCQPPK